MTYQADEIQFSAIDEVPKDEREIMDAVYLVVGFLRDLRHGFSDGDREKLDRYMNSRHGQYVICDISMLENQLPLKLIMGVVENLHEAMNEYKEMNPNEDPLISSIAKFDLKFDKESFHEVASLFCWYYSPFYSNKIKVQKDLNLLEYEHLFDLLYSTLVANDTKNETKSNNDKMRHVWATPTTEELLISGVKFKSDSDGVMRVKFSDWILTLPALIFDLKMETVVMNLLAWESGRGEKPVTRYLQFMKELIDDVGDVRIMKRCGILRGKWKRDEDVVDFVKRVVGFASYPSIYPPMDKAIESMKDFHGERMKNFLVRHKPAVMLWASSVAAVVSLLTAIFVNKRRGG
ncbi:uncharacterized protein LOC143892020 [Tasmannia lanceolata]|uniref:uncharacterized protein LOC143892020 n=1 Tax=Tasmannia lanceolata TaxID=3420 RepID=UPI0040637750